MSKPHASNQRAIPTESRPSDVEHFDDVGGTSGKSQEGRHNLVASQPGYDFVEGYLHGKIEMAVRQREREIGDRSQYGFVIEALDASHPGKHERAIRGVSPVEIKSRINARADQSLVFATDVEMVEGPDGHPSFVWLERFNSSKITLGKPLFAFNAFLRSHSLIGKENRKVRVFSRVHAIACGQDCTEKVERTAQRIDDRADPGIKGARQRIEIGYSQLATRIRIRLEPEFIRVVIDPVAESFLEDWDLGYGPVNGRLGI
jgi:hypothetical protein